jgi:hypothetical protein
MIQSLLRSRSAIGWERVKFGLKHAVARRASDQYTELKLKVRVKPNASD